MGWKWKDVTITCLNLQMGNNSWCFHFLIVWLKKNSFGIGQSCLFTFCFSILIFLKAPLMKVIYINNKHYESSADAVCCRITWKNNDERHQVLMRHLELHIKRQPGVFLHSWVNWSLSLMLCMSLKWQMPWFSKVNSKLAERKIQNARFSVLPGQSLRMFIYGDTKQQRA